MRLYEIITTYADTTTVIKSYNFFKNKNDCINYLNLEDNTIEIVRIKKVIDCNLSADIIINACEELKTRCEVLGVKQIIKL